MISRSTDLTRSARLRFSYSRQLKLPSPTEDETKSETLEDSEWLAVAERSIQQDLDTSKKELELIRDVLEDIKTSSRLCMKPDRRLDQMFLMRACQEYCGSRCHMLEERIRQVQSWSNSTHMGRKIPDRVPNEVPDEWLTVDMEWRQWLSEQAALQRNESSTGEAENGDFDATLRHWGSLMPLLTVYIA
ncbi:hypothetical protein F4677DRAFT_286575 [Hypoxylon crocopeplum]|nr:hypothetical protein F4677DRAFT_286575 [Hypoxylon crocopeplum]